MHLPRHTIESHAAVPLFHHASFCTPDPTIFSTSTPTDSARAPPALQFPSPQNQSQPAIFSCATLDGFLVGQTDPLKLVANRSWSSSQGGLSHAVPVQHTSLLFLVGGGRVPRFAPNKVVLWDEAAEYTVKGPTGSSQDVDSDDDDSVSGTSRRASTIFSAGSEFEAYGRARLDSSQSLSERKGAEHRSSSPADSLRFSTSSLVDADDLTADRPAPGHDEEDNPTLADSIVASSIGIGRMQASYSPDASGPVLSKSMLVHDERSDMESSTYAHSIMASSANLDDPFADEVSRVVTSGPSSNQNSDIASTSQARNLVSHDTSSINSSDDTSSASRSSRSQQRLFSSQTSRPAGAALVDSVSSMATTATDATAKAPPQILRGREVAELEFSEVVRGIYATTVPLSPLGQAYVNAKGKNRMSADSMNNKRGVPSRFCVILVVLLASKAIIFEVSPPSTTTNLDGSPASSAWRIQKRAAVQTYKNLKGHGSVAPYYEPATATGKAAYASIIVAVPGRQKGHVQILRIGLQDSAVAGSPTSISNASSSVGAASIIVAHESSIAAIALSPNGHMLATASSKGTLIRVWANDFTGTSSSGNDRQAAQKARTSAPGRTGFGTRLVRELRRGTDPATILSIAFAPDASLVAAASDKGTIHIFLLTYSAAASQGQSAEEQGRASPSSSSRAANLGRAAAQYLPAGIGNLAGQIPPSVLPQYLKSEWSSAQFRIPLKSFGASSRHYAGSSATDDNAIHGARAAQGAPAGTEKSTEGAWAQMRSRINDIRKGEASVDEKVFLCWIVEAITSGEAASSTASKGTKGDPHRSRTSNSQTRTSETTKQQAGTEADDCSRYRLIAVTTSGGWYKLGFTLPRIAAEKDVTGSTVLDMYRRDASSKSKGGAADKSNSMECHLLEYRPMVALLDGWRA